MKRIIAVSLIVGFAAIGAVSAQERTLSPGVTRSGQPASTVQQDDAAPASRRCSGAACLRSIPSLGVGF